MNNAVFSASNQKYSIAPLIQTGQTIAHTANDVNRFISNVGQGIDNIVAIQENDQMSALTKKYNEAQASFHDELQQAGGDISKQWTAYKKLYDTTRSLMESKDVNENVLQKFNAVANNDLGRLEGVFNHIHQRYLKDNFFQGNTEQAIALKTADDKTLAEAYRTQIKAGKPLGVTPNDVSRNFVSALSNAMIASVTPDTSVVELKAAKERLVNLTKVDKKLEGKPYYTGAIDKFNYLIHRKTSQEIAELNNNLKVLGNDFNKQIDVINNSDVLDSKQKQLYIANVKQNEHLYNIKQSIQDVNAVISDINFPMSEVRKYVKNLATIDSSLSKVEIKSLLDKAAVIRAKSANSKNKIQANEALVVAKNTINELKSRGISTDTAVNPKQLGSLISITSTKTGVVGVTDRTLFRHNNFAWGVKQSGGVLPSLTDAIDKGYLTEADTSFYKSIAKETINKDVAMFDNLDSNGIGALAYKINTSNTIGNLPAKVGSMFNVDLSKTDGLNKLKTNLDRLDVLLAHTNKDLHYSILGHNAVKYFAFKALSLDGSLTEEDVKKVNDYLSNPKARETLTVSDHQFFNDNYKAFGNDPVTQSEDRKMYDALVSITGDKEKAMEDINNKYIAMEDTHYRVSGVDTTNPNYPVIKKTLKEVTNLISFDNIQGGKDNVFYTNDPVTGNLLVGSKDYPASWDTGIPIVSKYDSNGNLIQLGWSKIVKDIYLIKQKQWETKYKKNPTIGMVVEKKTDEFVTGFKDGLTTTMADTIYKPYTAMSIAIKNSPPVIFWQTIAKKAKEYFSRQYKLSKQRDAEWNKWLSNYLKEN